MERKWGKKHRVTSRLGEDKYGRASAPTTIQESCEGIYKVCVTMTIACCGKFYTFEGKEHPW